jgi:hypothetical protein
MDVAADLKDHFWDYINFVIRMNQIGLHYFFIIRKRTTPIPITHHSHR